MPAAHTQAESTSTPSRKRTTMSQISGRAAAARENARRSDGKFGSYHLDDVGTDGNLDMTTVVTSEQTGQWDVATAAPEGYIDLYHRTSPEAAEAIYATGSMFSKKNTDEAFFSNRPDEEASGYGEAVVMVRVREDIIEIDDEFADGEEHYRVPLRAVTRGSLMSRCSECGRWVDSNHRCTDPGLELNYVSYENLHGGPMTGEDQGDGIATGGMTFRAPDGVEGDLIYFEHPYDGHESVLARIVRDGKVVGRGFADGEDIESAIATAQDDRDRSAVDPATWSSFEDVRAGMSAKYPGVEVSLTGHEGQMLRVSKIEVPVDQRGQGIATAVMNDLETAADANEWAMALTPVSDFGSSKTRLTEFYRRFGFAPNSGRNKDYSVSETMIRAARPKHGHPLAKAAPEPMTIVSAHRRTSLSTHTKGMPKEAFDRHVEPAGRYVIDVTFSGDGSHLDPSEWEIREVTFAHPLHIERGDYGDEESSWKRRLSAHYGGKKGKALSKALSKDGYDAIVTSDRLGHDEIVDLTELS